jgi:hypothetical protein
MKTRKKTLPAILFFAIAGVAFLFAALEEWVIDGGPLLLPVRTGANGGHR